MELEKAIESFKRYINSQEQKLDDYYRMDEEFYKDEIEQLELSLKLLRTVLNHLTKQEKMIQKIHESFCKFDWKNSNGEQVHNQLKELYESIFENKAEE